MVCPKCGGKTKLFYGAVKDKEAGEVYRCRRCVDCKHIFYTVEFEIAYEGDFKKLWRAARKEIEDRYLAKKTLREMKGE